MYCIMYMLRTYVMGEHDNNSECHDNAHENIGNDLCAGTAHDWYKHGVRRVKAIDSL